MKNIIQLLKRSWQAIAYCLLLSVYCPLANAQLFIPDQAEVFVETNGTLSVQGDTEIQNGGTLTMNGQSISIGGDFLQNGAYNQTSGQLKFTGTGVQNVSGNLSATNAPFDVVVEQGDNASVVNLQTNVEVLNTLEFVAGKVTTNNNEIYVKNTAADAITGHFAPNLTDGTYPSNDRFVEGNLAREVVNGTDYFFPLGNASDFYNPIQVENLSNNTGKITASFVAATLGNINFSGNIDCDQNNPAYSGSASNANQLAGNQAIDYDDMTGEGIWGINSNTNFDYEVIAYPNTANNNVNLSNGEQFRLLKRPSADDPATDWTAFATVGNPCIHSDNYHEVVGTGFSDFSIFGITGIAGSGLAVEWSDVELYNIDNSYFKLAWTTFSENKNRGFEIERSLDGQTFKSIGFVEGAGQSNSKNNYHFDDKTALFNTPYYYRIKQLDVDGTFDYSAIQTGILKTGESDFFMSDIFPNPTKNKALLTYQNTVLQDVEITLYSVTGQKVRTYAISLAVGLHQLELEVGSLPSGLYEVVIPTQDVVLVRMLQKL